MASTRIHHLTRRAHGRSKAANGHICNSVSPVKALIGNEAQGMPNCCCKQISWCCTLQRETAFTINVRHPRKNPPKESVHRHRWMWSGTTVNRNYKKLEVIEFPLQHWSREASRSNPSRHFVEWTRCRCLLATTKSPKCRGMTARVWPSSETKIVVLKYRVR